MERIFGSLFIILNIIGIILAEIIVCGGCLLLVEAVITDFEFVGVWKETVLYAGAFFLYWYISTLLFLEEWKKLLNELSSKIK